MVNKILTISVAAYNVGWCIQKTLESLAASRYLDRIEVLVIDDGSKDDTYNVAASYQSSYPQTFRVISKENGGHGSTINKGIAEATGTYFKVIDGDDWVDTALFDCFVELLNESSADMILTGYTEAYPHKRVKRDGLRQLDACREYPIDEVSHAGNITIHMLTVRTALLKRAGMRITEKCYYVDIELVVWAIALSRTLMYFDTPFYQYRLGRGEQSVSKVNMLKNVDMQRTVALNLAALYQSWLDAKTLSSAQELLCKKRIGRSIGATVRTYLLLPSAQEASNKIQLFIADVSNSSATLAEYMMTTPFFRAISGFDYIFLPAIRRIYAIRCGVKI